MKACHEEVAVDEARSISWRSTEPLGDAEIRQLCDTAQAFPLSNLTQLRLLATANELRTLRGKIRQLQETLGEVAKRVT